MVNTNDTMSRMCHMRRPLCGGCFPARRTGRQDCSGHLRCCRRPRLGARLRSPPSRPPRARSAASVAGLPSYSTSIEFFNRFTTACSTPATPEVVFSTRAEQAAQVMPETSKVCLWVIFYLANFLISCIASSMMAMLPASICSTTQVSRWFCRRMAEIECTADSAAAS